MRPPLGHGHYDSDGYSSEEENSRSASRHSSIFQANLYFVEDPDQPLSSIAGHTYSQVRHETGILSTSVDSSTTLVPNAVDVDTASDPADFENGDPKTEPLCVYTSPMEPTERPPPMPAPPAQKRAEALAEILFRQDMQTYGLHVSTSAAAMSYIRRSEYHEALRATEFNFRAIQSQQRGYGDLRNHPFYRATHEDTPLLRSGTLFNSENERSRRIQQHRSQLVGQERTSGGTVIWGTSIWGGLLAILCCMVVPINDYTQDSRGDWY
ncbi:hypothetical protein TWF225_009967 [Orbilia oligospora]|nr:hypothetical protein TWF751_011940 [Orbilia oligospora]KAF3172993.1 hypothetical protein TWF225_009967 [Orbilia oligospora]KAF3232650.1 hypothetical protein TWF128_003734 [Orbilia oligospora]KAF3237540.1 hypothetical protein TWF217_002066 [Orbilia oligospora]KAF3285852.1 hypothetical protein TWF132_009068 [Orbilia oligospora]